jgi:hypothetical protein
MDPLGSWWDLVRFGRRDRWDKLKGEAVLALDHRVAAEMLLRFHEDLAAAGAAPIIEPPDRRYADPRHRQIPRDDAGLEQAVTDFGLSPHPSLVLVLEGETEMVLVPRALDAPVAIARPACQRQGRGHEHRSAGGVRRRTWSSAMNTATSSS